MSIWLHWVLLILGGTAAVMLTLVTFLVCIPEAWRFSDLVAVGLLTLPVGNLFLFVWLMQYVPVSCPACKGNASFRLGLLKYTGIYRCQQCGYEQTLSRHG